MSAGPIYDAILHALFLGFTFGMIFGHAPIIFPAVLGRPLPYRPAFYLHLILLQATLLLRIGGFRSNGLEAVTHLADGDATIQQAHNPIEELDVLL